MKHAIMIMAHNHLNLLHRIIKYFEKDCDVFIHIDIKSFVTNKEINELVLYPQVRKVLRKYCVNWGGTSVLECEMYLLKVAYENSEAEYFHLISGHDTPIRPLSLFFDFFSNNKGKEYLQYVHLPHPKREGNTYRRLQYYYPYDYSLDNVNPRKYVQERVALQHAQGTKRPIPDVFDHLYGSSQWFSITRTAVITELYGKVSFPI